MLMFSNVLGQTHENINAEIKKGKECLKSENSNCQIHFKRALISAQKCESKKILSRTYLDVAISYYRSEKSINDGDAYFDKGIQIAKQESLQKLEWAFFETKAKNFYKQGNLIQLKNYCDSAEMLSDIIQQPETTFFTLNLIAGYDNRVGNYKSELTRINEMYQIAKTLKDPTKEELCYGKFAAAYYTTEDYKLCLKYQHLALDASKEMGDSSSTASQMTNIGNVLILLKKPKEAIEKLLSANEYFEHHSRHYESIYALAQLGNAYNENGEFDKAIPVLEKCLLKCKTMGAKAQEAFCSSILSNSYTSSGDKLAALKYSTSAYEFYKDQPPSSDYLSCLKTHIRALGLNGKHKESNILYSRYISTKDTLFNTQKTKEIAKIQEELETELKNEKIQNLEQEKKTIANRNLALLFGIILIGIIAWLLIKRKTTKLKLQKTENKNINLQLESKNRELTSQALHLAQKNELLISLKADISTLKTGEDSQDLSLLESKIKFDEQMDKNWEQFTKFFNETKKDFFKSITNKHPDVTKSDLRMAALLSMNLDSKEIANILNISADGVKKARYRLRKKLQLLSDDNLRNYLASF